MLLSDSVKRNRPPLLRTAAAVMILAAVSVFILSGCAGSGSVSEEFINTDGTTVKTRISVPEGYQRTAYDDDSFGTFMRNYPLKPDGSPVMLHDGSRKSSQNHHVAVYDMTLSSGDLQQCADSVIRTYAEYFYSRGEYSRISFDLTSGFRCDFDTWRKGGRLVPAGNDVEWSMSSAPDSSQNSFEAYLSSVFNYAGTYSLAAESSPVQVHDIQIGDIFIKAGSPGHVCMVADVCEKDGRKAFLLAQGYMPAQEFHILKNPLHPEDPWYYEEEVRYPFETPEYTFEEGSLKRPVYLD